ncbi:MAG: glycosyltransferase [Elusimicrobia bacterium]|nr:glycosyltransferase [Elusimicrobiota bacterium]
MAKAIAYLAYGGAERTVFDSQVVNFLKKINGRGVAPQLFVFHPWKDFLFNRPYIAQKKRECLEATGQAPVFLPRVPRNMLGLNTGQLKRAVGEGASVIHARGFQSAALALALKKSRPGIKVILDCRGLEAQEYALILEGEKKRRPTAIDRRWLETLRTLERETTTQADHIFCVSESLKRHLIAHYGAVPQRIDVIPCCVDLDRFDQTQKTRDELRKKLGIGNRLTLIYAGSIRAWQPARWLAIALSAIKKLNPASCLLILTPDRADAEEALRLEGCSPDDYRILTTSHESTPEYLAAADIGLLIRPLHIVNQVACPTKAGEYLAAGLMILGTAHPEDLAVLINKEKVGRVVAAPDDQRGLEQALRELRAQLSTDADSWRQRARNIAKTDFGWETYLPVILKRYDSL